MIKIRLYDQKRHRWIRSVEWEYDVVEPSAGGDGTCQFSGCDELEEVSIFLEVSLGEMEDMLSDATHSIL